MNLDQILEKYHSEEYDFLRNEPCLGDNLMLLGLGGSHAYGMDNENSDLDIRGIATNTAHAVLSGRKFEHYVEPITDTMIYSLEKMAKLLANCNPNTIEILGLRPEHYLYLNKNGLLLLSNRKLFLSQRASYAFGAYATSQLRRMENKAVRIVSQSEQERHILRTINDAKETFKEKIFQF